MRMGKSSRRYNRSRDTDESYSKALKRRRLDGSYKRSFSRRYDDAYTFDKYSDRLVPFIFSISYIPRLGMGQ